MNSGGIGLLVTAARPRPARRRAAAGDRPVRPLPPDPVADPTRRGDRDPRPDEAAAAGRRGPHDRPRSRDAAQLGQAGRPPVRRRRRRGAASIRSAASACRGRSRASASSGRRRSRRAARRRRADARRSSIATWKERFPTFWPKGARFYAPLAGIAPGEVALLDIPPGPGLAGQALDRGHGHLRGRRVVHVHDPRGPYAVGVDHLLRPSRPATGATVAQAQALERTSDPFDELAYMLGGNRMNDRFWRHDAREPRPPRGRARTRGRDPDRVRRPESAVAPGRNVRNSATLRTARHTITAPVRWLTRR